MKGCAFFLTVGIVAVVSCQKETVPEKTEIAPENSYNPNGLPNIYSFLNHQVPQESHAGEHAQIIPRPLGALSLFKTELLPPLMFVGLLGLGLWLVGSFIKTFILTKLHNFLPLVSLLTRHRRDAHSHIDDLTATIMAAITSQECLEKAACELGHHAKHIQVAKGVLPVLDKMSSKVIVQAFQNGLSEKNACEKYFCNFNSS